MSNKPQKQPVHRIIQCLKRGSCVYLKRENNESLERASPIVNTLISLLHYNQLQINKEKAKVIKLINMASQNIGNIDSTTREEEKQITKNITKDSEFLEQLRLLENIGFKNYTLNLQLLRQFEGNVQRCFEELCKFEDNQRRTSPPAHLYI